VPVTIHHGDCLDVMRGMDAASIDAVVTDPPYFLPAVHYNTRKRFPKSLSDLSMLEHFYRDVFAEFARVLKPTGCAYVFCDDHSYPVFYTVAYRQFEKQRALIWDKVVSFNGWSWRKQHELILFAEMHEAPAVKTGDGDIVRCRSVKVDDRVHPAQKPVELLRTLIRKSCPPGSLILDPFAGSGATGEAAQAENCNAILIEREADYVGLHAAQREHGDAPLLSEVA
jgi:DNA modification methylase